MTDYALLVFDWDGTLVDSIARIVDSMKAAARETALPERDDTRIKGIIGLGLPEAIASLYPEVGDPALVERFRCAYSEHYLAQEAQPSRLFPGVAEAMVHFREAGFRLAVATGKSRRGLDRVLAAWLERFLRYHPLRRRNGQQAGPVDAPRDPGALPGRAGAGADDR